MAAPWHGGHGGPISAPWRLHSGSIAAHMMAPCSPHDMAAPWHDGPLVWRRRCMAPRGIKAPYSMARRPPWRPLGGPITWRPLGGPMAWPPRGAPMTAHVMAAPWHCCPMALRPYVVTMACGALWLPNAWRPHGGAPWLPHCVAAPWNAGPMAWQPHAGLIAQRENGVPMATPWHRGPMAAPWRPLGSPMAWQPHSGYMVAPWWPAWWPHIGP